MANETYDLALESTLTEIQNICPDITHTFMFNEEGKIITNQKTPKKTISRIVASFEGMFEKAKAIGGFDYMALEASKGRVYVTKINDIHLVTVTSKKADIQFIDTVTRIIVPAVLRLLEKISPTPLKKLAEITEEKHEPEIIEETEEPAEEVSTEKQEEETVESEFQTEPQTHQLMVENLSGGFLGGLLVSSDTVNIDSTILTQWEELYENQKIEEVEIETFHGKTIRCKVKPIKDSKYDGKGVIQMPEKIQQALEIRKGELVRVKPIIY